MNSGTLDKLITIQVRTTSRDAVGGLVETWASERTTWASRADSGGREFNAANVTNSEVTTIWKMRYFDGLTTAHRILFGGDVFDVVYVSMIGRRDGLLVQTKILK